MKRGLTEQERQQWLKEIEERDKAWRKRDEERLARLSPEQREMELKFWEDHKAKEDKINNEIKQIESKLTPEQIELRKQIIQFNNYCSVNKRIHAENKEEAKKLKEEAKKESTQMLKEILKKIKKDIVEAKPLLRKEEWDEFVWRCSNWKEAGSPILFYTHIIPRPTKEEIEEAERKGLI